MQYSAYFIADFLDKYAQIDAGDFSNLEQLERPLTRHSAHRSPFETPIIIKSDIDLAIDKLGIKGRWLKWCKNIWQEPKGLNYKQIRLAQYIMGEPVLIIPLVKEVSKILGEGVL